MDVNVEKRHVLHYNSAVSPPRPGSSVAALFVSFVSIRIACRHGEVKPPVHENEKLVEASARPDRQSQFSGFEKTVAPVGNAHSMLKSSNYMLPTTN